MHSSYSLDRPSSLRSSGSKRAFLALAVCIALSGCGDDEPPPQTPDGGPAPDASAPDGGGSDAGGGQADGGSLGPAPLFRNPVQTPDRELATEALRIMGTPQVGGSGSCRSCHAISQRLIRDWQTFSEFAWTTCLADLEVRTVESANAVVECLRAGEEGDRYEASTLGVFSSAARLAWFPFVFERALGAGWRESYDAFAEKAGMPYEPETHPSLTQEQFDVVAEWFIRGVPELDEVLPENPGPTECTPSITADVAAHVTEMATAGWRARNVESGILMYGCAGAATPLGCLGNKPRASETTFGANWEMPEGTHLRVLSSYSNRSSFWTRSSADGRFVAHGGGDGGMSTFIDLQPTTPRFIGANASYDPAFFPDNSGFVFQGAGAHFCEQSVLFTGMPTTITFNEPQCETNNEVGLYEHLGASLGGGDYWAVHGEFVSDDGGDADPGATFPEATMVRLTRLVNDGTGFTPRETLNAETPWEGDAVISPSSRLMVTRLGGRGTQLGYVIRRVQAQRDGSGNWSVSVPEIARYCIPGGKPAISYDERWMVVHHYEGDHSNVWVIDLLSGQRTQITNMQSGQYALFPHFRSDGWIYFVVRDRETREHVVASDAALVLAR